MNDDHYYIAGYSIEDDPYIEPNGVLKNLLGITNTTDLNEVESELSSLAIEDILKKNPPTEYSTQTLQNIHKEIFSEIYPWAGEFRKVDIAKGDTHFESHANISSELDALFQKSKFKNFFLNLPLDDFSQEAASFLVKLNTIHPFREGNGRSQRLLLTQITLNAGYNIEWSGVSDSAMKHACIDGANGNTSTMKNLLKIYLAPTSLKPLSKHETLEVIDELRDKYLNSSEESQNKP